MHKGHKTLIKFLLLELHTLDLFRNTALYTWHSNVCVSPTSTVFKIMIRNMQQSKNIAGHVHKGLRTLIKCLLRELHTLDLLTNFPSNSWHSRAVSQQQFSR